MKRQPREQEEVFANHIFGKVLTSKMGKRANITQQQKRNQSISKMASGTEGVLPKMTYECPRST